MQRFGVGAAKGALQLEIHIAEVESNGVAGGGGDGDAVGERPAAWEPGKGWRGGGATGLGSGVDGWRRGRGGNALYTDWNDADRTATAHD